MTEPPRLTPPTVVTRTRTVPAEVMTTRALALADALGASVPDETTVLALVLGNDAESVALFFAAATLERPLLLLGPDPRGWVTDPAWPRGTCLVLPPGRAHLAGEAAARGLGVCLVAEPDSTAARGTTLSQRAPALVFLTSGSTGAPKPVHRRFDTLVGAARMLASVLPLPDGAGIIGAVPLDRALGANNALMLATVTGRPLGLLDRFDHNDFLALCEERAWGYWAGTPALADVLSRSTRPVPPGMPPWGTVAGRISAPLADAYRQRFGVPLRALYGTTETFTVAAALGPADEIRPGTVGRPLPGIDVAIGAPGASLAPGEAGRVWIRSPWMMDGYGYPPAPANPVENGWWATPDIGRLDADGHLTIVGRADDRIRTAAGHVLDPQPIAAALERVDGVREVVVLPVDETTGASFAVLVEADASVRTAGLRAAMSAVLPAAALPRRLRVVDRLPRLGSGRVDRRACLDLLTGSPEPVA